MPRKNKNKKTTSLEGKVAQLTAAVGKMSTGPKKKRRRGARKSAATATGDVIISRRELFQVVKTEASKAEASGNEYIAPNKFSFLKNIDKCFERYRFNRCQFYYKPAVGTTYGGLISYGVDWTKNHTTADRKSISGFSPNKSHSCWTDTERSPLVLPVARLQTLLWYSCGVTDASLSGGPGALVWAADVTSSPAVVTLGEIWVDYTVHFSGTVGT